MLDSEENQPQVADLDEFSGLGGSYTIDENGKRVQVEAPTAEPKRKD